MRSDRIQEGHCITSLWWKQQKIQGNSPNSTTGFSTIFSTCENVFLCVWMSGGGVGVVVWVGGLMVEKVDDLYLDDKVSSWRVLREWVPLALLFNRLDIFAANHFGVSPMCMIIFGGFLYTSTLLMMVMSVMWCQLRCHYTLPGNTMFHLNNIRCFTRQKPSKKSSFKQTSGLICCKINIITWQYNFKKQTHQTTPFKRSRKESKKTSVYY